MAFGKLDKGIAVVAFAMLGYHFLSTQYLFFSSTEHVNTHLMFALVLVFLPLFRRRKKAWPLASALIIGGLATTVYIHIFCEQLLLKWTLTPLEVALGIILMLVVIEGTREGFGPILPAFCILFTLYAFFGHYLTGPLYIMGLPLDKSISKLVMGLTTGMYGTALAVSADYIFLFIMFGAILGLSGATNFFVEIGRLLGRRLRSGPAFTAVLTSALVGMCSGAATANIATTGAFTIPLMKRVGYTPEQAGGIETAASTGGQLMPPVMGVAAFLMAGFTGIPYLTIIAAAAIPAILYFASVGIYVQLQAMKLKITPVAEEVNIGRLLVTAPIFFVPLTVLVVLLVQGHTVSYCIFWAITAIIVLTIVIGLFRKELRRAFGEWVEAISRGAILASQIALTCACLGLVVAVFNIWGLGIKIPALVELVSGGILPIAIMLTAFVTIIISTGLPTGAVYLLVILVTAPVLLKMGLPLLIAHFFVFYMGCMSYATPPVAMGALVASKLAGGGFLRTAGEAMKAAIAGFIVPILFVMSPALMLQSSSPLLIVASVIAAGLVLLVLQVSICGHYLTSVSLMERYILFPIVLVLLMVFFATHNYLWLAAGAGFLILLTYWQWVKKHGGSVPWKIMAWRSKGGDNM